MNNLPSISLSVKIWLLISTLGSIAGLSSIIDGIVNWAWFFQDFLDVYRGVVAFFFEPFYDLLSISPPYWVSDILTLWLLFSAAVRNTEKYIYTALKNYYVTEGNLEMPNSLLYQTLKWAFILLGPISFIASFLALIISIIFVLIYEFRVKDAPEYTKSAGPSLIDNIIVLAITLFFPVSLSSFYFIIVVIGLVLILFINWQYFLFQ